MFTLYDKIEGIYEYVHTYKGVHKIFELYKVFFMHNNNIKILQSFK